MKRKIVLYLFLFVSLITISIIIYFFFFHNTEKALVVDYNSCIDAGNEILETYPEQCVAEDGMVYIRPLELGDLLPDDDSYYGFSTGGSCVSDDDCVVSGCNGEICQSVEESVLSSICMKPLTPTPKEIGLVCGCEEKSCVWK